MPVEQETVVPTPDREDTYSPRGTVYSWGKTARKLTEPAFKQVLKGATQDIVAVDICSSYPLYREIMMGQHKQRRASQARKSVDLFANAALYVGARSAPAGLDAKDLTALRNIFRNEDMTRDLFDGAVFDVLMFPPSPDERNEETISSMLLDNFLNSDRTVGEAIEPPGSVRGAKGSWVYITSIHRHVHLWELLNSVLKGATYSFLAEAARHIGSYLVKEDKLRNVTFLSLDCEPLKKMAEDAKAKEGFPQALRKTLFFRAAGKGSGHMLANALYLPFRQESIGFFASSEGWPYYFEDAGRANLGVAQEILTQLAPGGRAVFFPWETKENSFRIRSILREIEKMWRGNGLEVEKEEHDKEQIKREMSDRELMLAEHSPLFRFPGKFTVLTLSKPVPQTI